MRLTSAEIHAKTMSGAATQRRAATGGENGVEHVC